jgi:acyl-CoA synthetase (AMP-forming)/AMP-acid ligase II
MPLNIADRLRVAAETWPHRRAVVFPHCRDRHGRTAWTHLTFAPLDQESDRLARGLRAIGIEPGLRIALLVPPSLEFIALTYALFKVGAVIVLIDPGMGLRRVASCLRDVRPQGFVAIPAVHAVRRVLRLTHFRSARCNVTVGGRALLGGPTYESLRGGAWSPLAAAPTDATEATDPAAIIFTSGSTGPPKGVLYEHGMFDAQVDLLRDFYGIEPGEIDLPGFPLFALFNAAMGVTTVIPEMNPTRPADVDPRKIVEAIHSQGVTQAFGSPAMWNRIGRHCEAEGITFPTLRRVLSAGAPVPGHVLERMRKTLVAPGADIHTPYGATESLPIASISGEEILMETAVRSRKGAGTCVGRLFPRVDVRIIAITDGPIASLGDVLELPPGEIGEIVVRAPSTTRQYVDRPDATRAAKIPDGDSFWHRMGDVGYRDADGRLWFCGRKAHIVETEAGRMFSVPCEAIFNEHPRVYRSALVGIGPQGRQTPVILIEPEPDQRPNTEADRQQFTRDLLALAQANRLTERIEHVLFHDGFPVDVRHNIKINREALAEYAATKLSRPPTPQATRKPVTADGMARR